MEKVIEKIDQITNFKDALKAFTEAKSREARLKVKHQTAYAREYVDAKGKAHSLRNMKATTKTEKETEAFELATVEATAFQYMVEYLGGVDPKDKLLQRPAEPVEGGEDMDCVWHDFE